MLEAKIIDRGRGPEIAGTRITIYDVLDYYKSGLHRDMIADTLELSSEQVEVAIRYIEGHRTEVMVEYGEMLGEMLGGTLRSSKPSWTPDMSDSWPWSGNGSRRRPRRTQMRGILADINVGKQRRAILAIWASDTWRDLWNGLGLSVLSFPALGLALDSSDAVVWRICQREELVLITGNRNRRGPDSLEAVIQRENQPDSLPVVTIASADRVLEDRLYAEEVAERILDYLMRIDEVRGAGRLYVP